MDSVGPCGESFIRPFQQRFAINPTLAPCFRVILEKIDTSDRGAILRIARSDRTLQRNRQVIEAAMVTIGNIRRKDRVNAEQVAMAPDGAFHLLDGLVAEVAGGGGGHGGRWRVVLLPLHHRGAMGRDGAARIYFVMAPQSRRSGPQDLPGWPAG